MAEKQILSVRIDDETSDALTSLMERENCDRVTAIRHALSVASQPPKPAPVNVSDGIKPEDVLILKKEKKFEPF